MWPPSVQALQGPSGEEMLGAMLAAPAGDPASVESRLRRSGVPPDLAQEIVAAHDPALGECILGFYRSAVPNVAADWWQAVGRTLASGLVLLLPDPPEEERMSLEVATQLGARTARLEGLDHCWMAEGPEQTLEILRAFWASLEEG